MSGVVSAVSASFNCNCMLIVRILSVEFCDRVFILEDFMLRASRSFKNSKHLPLLLLLFVYGRTSHSDGRGEQHDGTCGSTT